MGGQQAGRAGQHRGVEVVPAGVHAVGGGGERQSGALRDRQRVHVAAQQHGGAGSFTAQHGRHGAEAAAGGDVERQPVEGAEHRFLGAGQVEAEFRNAVQRAPQAHQVVGEGGGVVEEVHVR